MVTRSLLAVVLAALHYPVAILATPSQLLEIRAAMSSTATTTAQPTSGTGFDLISTFPNGVTTTVCNDTTYYRTIDEGQLTAGQVDDFISKCEASCLPDSQCSAYVLQMKLATDTDLATGVCFFYDHTPVPQPCNDDSSRALYAECKGTCAAVTESSTTSSSMTTATRSTTPLLRGTTTSSTATETTTTTPATTITTTSSSATTTNVVVRPSATSSASAPPSNPPLHRIVLLLPLVLLLLL